MRATIAAAVGIGLAWLAGQACGAGEAAPAPDQQKIELKKQLDKIDADKSARQAVLEVAGDLAKVKKAYGDAQANLDKVLGANPKYGELEKARSEAKKALKKAVKDGAADAVVATAQKALADATAARDAYLEDHPEVAAATRAEDGAKDAFKEALENAKDADTEYSALREQETELEAKLQALEKKAAPAPKAE